MKRMIADEQQIQDAILAIENMIDPFRSNIETDGISNLSSGLVTSEDITRDLTDAHEKGDRSFTDFIQKQLLCENPDISFLRSLN